jgi:hypothetical protein
MMKDLMMNSKNGNTLILSRVKMEKKILKLIILKHKMFLKFFFPFLSANLMPKELMQLSSSISMLIKEKIK